MERSDWYCGPGAQIESQELCCLDTREDVEGGTGIRERRRRSFRLSLLVTIALCTCARCAIAMVQPKVRVNRCSILTFGQEVQLLG
jgi:hypothetical protein